jgi:RNA polymerase sigma-70 factor (ECF subfamily)
MLRKARAAVLRRGADWDEAEDLVQEAFLRLEGYERDHVVRSREAFLVSAAVNLSIDQARRAARAPFEVADNLEALASAQPPPDEIVAARARLDHLRAGIERLPERTRRILLARRIDGLSFRDIAEREGASISAVEKQVARATLALMEWMDGW